MSALSEIEATTLKIAKQARAAAAVLRSASTRQKNDALARVATALRGQPGDQVLKANEIDVAAAEKAELSGAMLDRLRLDRARLNAVASGVDQVRALADPVGELSNARRMENGILVGRMRVPIGVIGIIYESRPNVTADAAALCVKSGNACVLRGGSEAFHSNSAISKIFYDSLEAAGLPKASAGFVPTTDRAATRVLLGLDGIIDVIIPRGGETLIRFVTEHARIPVIQHYKGVCHVFVDRDADLDMALDIAVNGKTQRPGVCNAVETILVDAACAKEFLPRLGAALDTHGVEIRGDQTVQGILPEAKPATEQDWDAEYLDLIVSVRVVEGIDGAIAHVGTHGSNHTDAIVTKNYDRAQRWVREIDSSLVLVNASTRFNDGQQLGLGAEIGISTTKLHAYGPMGLAELCTLKWVGYGEGQVRT